MEKVIDTAITSLLEVSRRLHTNFLNYIFKQRKFYYVFIPICSSNFLQNTRLKEYVDIVEMNELLNIMEADEKQKMTHCLEQIYKEGKTEPYTSICSNLLKQLTRKYQSIAQNSKRKKLIVIDDFKVFDLITFSKRKLLFIPLDEMIYNDITGTEKERYETLKILIKIDNMESLKNKFKSIEELDTLIFEKLSLTQTKKEQRKAKYLF